MLFKMIIHDIYYVSRALYYLVQDYIIEEYIVRPNLKNKYTIYRDKD